MNTDPIADMLTRLRNAHSANHDEVRMPYSKVKYAILQVMVKSKMIESVSIDTSEQFKNIIATFNDRPHKLKLKRISKPGQRIYVNAGNIPSVLNGLGISILSTSKGMMTGHEAKRTNLGGELICEIY
jgi:small subunit ribosomal protein S8